MIAADSMTGDTRLQSVCSEVEGVDAELWFWQLVGVDDSFPRARTRRGEKPQWLNTALEAQPHHAASKGAKRSVPSLRLLSSPQASKPKSP